MSDEIKNSAAEACVIKKTSIGGQAVIEGVMMRGPEKIAVAVRKPDGDIIVCLLYTSPSPRDLSTSRMPSSA